MTVSNKKMTSKHISQYKPATIV